MYPQELLPRKSIKSPTVDIDSMFVRTLKIFPYDCLEGDNFLPEITDEILVPKGEIEIYSLSLYIYGVYNENHFNIIVSDRDYNSDWDGQEELSDVPYELQERFAVFLKTSLLEDNTIEYTDEKGHKDLYHLHYEHKPTRANFWHFELFVTKNDEIEHIPRKSGATREKVAEKIKDDILFFAAKEAKEKFFSLYSSMLKFTI